MSDEDQKKPEIPHRMSRIAWPNAKYGLYLAIIIIILFLLISLQRFNFLNNFFYGKGFIKNSKTKKNKIFFN